MHKISTLIAFLFCNVNIRLKTILAYLEEAIRNQEEGKEIKPDRNKPVEISLEMELSIKSDPRDSERDRIK